MLGISLQDVVLRAIAYAIVAGLAIASGFLTLRFFSTDRWTVLDDDAIEGPAGHFDLLGLVAAILFRQSWIRPILPNPAKMRGGRAGVVLWVVTNLLILLVVFWLAKYLRIPIASLSADTVSAGATALINMVVELGVWFVVLNVLPIPPLWGSNFIVAVAPQLRERVRRFYWIGVVLLIVLMYFQLTGILRPVVTVLQGWVA